MPSIERDLPSASAPPRRISLMAIDLDGTLLTSDKTVSEQTVNALKDLPQDVRVVIASARPPRAVRHIYRQLGLTTWQINYNGAMIWDEVERKPIFHQPMEGTLVSEMIEVARDMYDDVLVTCEIMDRWHTDRLNNEFTTETGRLFKPDVVAPCETFCNQPITKLMLLGKPAMLQRLEKPLKQFRDQVTIVQTDRDLIQIMDKRVSKSAALARVAAHYGIPHDQILAIGDAPNDVGMLQMAGVAVAMSNAYDVVKKVAHWIAPSNDDHGVHAAMLRYGLCK